MDNLALQNSRDGIPHQMSVALVTKLYYVSRVNWYIAYSESVCCLKLI